MAKKTEKAVITERDSKGRITKGGVKNPGRKVGSRPKHITAMEKLEEIGFDPIEAAYELYKTTESDKIKDSILGKLIKVRYPTAKTIEVNHVGGVTNTMKIEFIGEQAPDVKFFDNNVIDAVVKDVAKDKQYLNKMDSQPNEKTPEPAKHSRT